MNPKTPSLDAMKLALNNQRMYSPLEKAAMAVPRTKGTPAEFMAEVSKQPGFRKDEVEDRRISLPEQKMTKEEFLGHLKNHPAPLLNERVLGGDDFYEQANDRADAAYGQSYDDLGLRQQGLIDYDLENDYGYNPKPQYEDWALPGGGNYREVLLTLPKKGLTDRERDQMMWIEANARRGEISAKDAAQLEALKRKQQQGAQDYQSSHWQDHPNVLAHMRLSDRRGPNGEKILHVDEVQSDWHQQGRKEGYNDASGKLALNQEVERLAAKYGISPNEPNKLSKLRSVVDSDELGNLMDLNKSANTGVPDAPFKKNWHELALKHVLGEAARGGYHGIAITPGDVQADRYDLSKQIDQIKYIQNSDGTYDMSVRPKGERRDTMFIGDKSLNGLSEQELEGIVGKEVAQKMVSGEGPQGGDNYRSLSGLDLQVGGEGMRGFYDKILPTFLNKLGKPHGAQVGTINVQGDPKKRPEIMQQMGVDPIRFGLMPRDHQQRISQQADALNQQPLHYFPITDSLRQQVKTEGLPQYDKGGKVNPIDELRKQLGTSEPFDPIGNMKRNVSGAMDVIKAVPGNLQRLATDPVAYVRSLPTPTGEQIMNMAGPGNIGFAGMMIGPKARTFHTGRAEMAKAMEEAGRTPQEIWTATGTVKGPDGIWRQEISDKGSTFNMIDDLKIKAQQYKDMIEAKKAVLRPDKSGQKDFWPKALTEAKKPVREEIAGLKQDLSEISKSPRTQGVAAQWTLDHPELYAAYPELGALPIVQTYKSGPDKGSLTSSGGRLYQMDVHDPRDPRSVALHEMQHAIQGIEGMTPGANPSMAFRAPEYPALLERIRSNPEEFPHLKVVPRDTDKAAFEWYRRQHGEAEARATQARRDMDAAQRAAKFPYENFDVPQQQLLMRQPETPPGKVSEARGGRVHPLLPDFED